MSPSNSNKAHEGSFSFLRHVAKFLTYLFVLLATHHWSLGQDSNDLIDISIAADASVLRPGDSTWLILDVKVSSGWHAYWKTAGETGFPTSIKWEVPDGVTIGKLGFPVPKVYEFEDLSSYVLEEKFSLLAKLELDSDWDVGIPLLVEGEFSTLLCNESNCVPFDSQFKLEIQTEGETRVDRSVSKKVSQAMRNLPQELPREWKASLVLQDKAWILTFTGQSLSEFSPSSFYFFPEGDLIEHGSEQTFSFTEKDGVLRVPLAMNPTVEASDSLRGVLAHGDSGWLVEIGLGALSSFDKPMTPSASGSKEQNERAQNDLQTLWTLLAMVLVAMAVWVYGKTNQPVHSRKRKASGKVLALIIFGTGLWIGFPKSSVAADGIVWQTWSPELQSRLVEEGRGVYVDFTAKWCLSCQVNKRVFKSERVIQGFRDSEIVALRADWTKRGPIILEALQEHGREGVPLNLYFPPSEFAPSNPRSILMPEILTEKIVLTVLETEEAYLNPKADGFWAILGFALLGGVMLNLMPCVFPVIGLKIMAFVRQSGENRIRIKRHGLFFTLGVLLSFWFLLGALLFLRETLEQELGWGFQLQEPIFVFALAVFLLVFALSLSGLFEIGASLTSLGSKSAQEDGYLGSFFSGVLATVVATPCMAPFLGVAIGAALTMDWARAYLVFTFIGVGLSFPYLVFSYFPSLLSKLPKPGDWMDTFKQFMAFPLYATVAWLLWTLQSLL